MTSIIRETVLKYRGPGRKVSSIMGPADVAHFVARVVDGDPREHLIAVYLDARHAPIGYCIVSVGTLNSCLVHPREVFRAAITCGAFALIVAHNHPSGDPSPSAEDEALTVRLREAGTLLGIELLDSIVVGDACRWVSLLGHQQKGDERV